MEGYEVVGQRVVPWVRDSYWDRRILALTHLPVRYPMIAVYEWLDAWSVPGGSWPPASQLQDGGDFQLDQADATFCWTGHLIRRSGTWSFQERTIKCVYNAGFTPSELASQFPKLRLATVQAIVANFIQLKMYQPDQVSRGGGVGAIQSESLENWQQTYSQSVDTNFGLNVDLPYSVKRTLADMVRYSKFLS